MSEPEKATPKRVYRSKLREERAAQNRRHILAAASELFRTGGFAATTIAAIAERAGVSVPTVYAVFGSKGAVLAGILGQMEEAADAARWRAAIAAESDPAKLLGAFAQWTKAFFTASRPMLTIVRGAADDEHVAELAQLGNMHRRSALEALIERIAQCGAAVGGLQDGLSRSEAVDRAWILTGIETYLNAVEGCGWSDVAYADWLTTTLRQQLLEPQAP